MAVQQLQHTHGTSVVPSDTLYLYQSLGYPYRVTSALFVGVGGSVRVLTEGGDDVVFSSVPDGTFMPVHVVKVFATGTTASSIVAVDLSNLSPYSYLLDAYSGAAAAYSLRQLSSSYSGSAIRVRRSSDNTEQDIGFTSNELDVTALTSFCSGTNGFVTTWYDQSGNGNNLVQTTATRQTKIYDSSTGVITENGKAAVRFDGSDDFFLSSNTLALNNQWALIHVLNGNASARNYQQLFSRTPSSTTVGTVSIAQYIGGNNLQNVLYPNGDARQFTPPTPNNVFGSQKLMINEWNAGNYNLVVNTNLENYTFTSTNGFTTALNFALGAETAGSLSYGGTMQEFVLYTTDQSTNRTGIETNINNFYSIY